MPYTYEYPRPACTADCVIFGWNGELQVLLMERRDAPFAGMLSLPGSFVRDGKESPMMAAVRAARDKTGIVVKDVFPTGYYGDPDRDPRGHTISGAFAAFIYFDGTALPTPGGNATAAMWVPVNKLSKMSIGFDHKKIIFDARAVLAERLRSTPDALTVLPSKFRIADLRNVFAGVIGEEVDVRNFASNFKRLVKAGVFSPAGIEKNVSHRPAELFKYDMPACKRFLKAGGRFAIASPAAVQSLPRAGRPYAKNH